MWELRFSVGVAAHLEQDLQGPVDDAHPPSRKMKKGTTSSRKWLLRVSKRVEPPRERCRK